LNELFAIDLAFVLQAIIKKGPSNQHQNLTANTHRSNQSNETKSKSTKPDAESIEIRADTYVNRRISLDWNEGFRCEGGGRETGRRVGGRVGDWGWLSNAGPARNVRE
jgi:hypothetical protein